MAQWHDITRDPDYQSLSEAAKLEVKRGFFDRVIASDPEFGSLSNEVKQATFQQFMQTPDDTGQGYVTSMLGAAGRGFGEMVPGAIEGVGALTGSEGLREAGQSLRGTLEEISPVNPIYAESVPVKLAGVGGQALSMLATAGAGGAAGKALGGIGAVSKGAQGAALGSAFLQGAAGGAREAEQYGMTGPEAYLKTLAGGMTEAGTELLPFGMASETALAKRMFAGAPRATTFAGAVGSEFGEESLGQIASNITTKALAPAGVETPGITEGALEAGLYGAFGGGVMGGINALIPTAPEKQTPEQKQWQAEINATPVDVAPPITPEESQKNATEGGIPVVTPDGTVSWMPAVSQAIAQQGPQPQGMPSDIEQRLRALTENPEIEVAARTLNETKDVPFTKVSAQTAVNIVAQNAEISMQPPVQPEQEAEAPAVVGMPAPTQAGEVPISEGAERNRAIIADAAAKMRGQLPPEVSAGLESVIPAQPTTPPENAPLEIPDEESLLQEPQDGVESGQTAEASLGDQLLGAAPSEEEIITPQGTPTPATEGMLTPGGVGTKRDATKPEQMTPEEVAADVGMGNFATLLGGSMLTPIKLHPKAVENAASKGKPVSSAAVDTYGITLPEGYVKQGDLYVFQPRATGAPVQAAPSAAKPEQIDVSDAVGIKAASTPEELLDRAAQLGMKLVSETPITLMNGTQVKNRTFEFNTSEGIRSVTFRDDGPRSKGESKQTPWRFAAVLQPVAKPLPQTTTVATNETAPPSAKGEAVASAELQPVEGSIPTVPKVSAEETVKSTEKSLEAKTPALVNRRVEQILNAGGRTMVDDLDKLLKSLSDQEFNDFVQSNFFEDPSVAIKPTDSRQAKNAKRKAASDMLAKGFVVPAKAQKEANAFEQAERELEQEQQKQNAQSISNLFGPKRTNPVKGRVKYEDARDAMSQLQLSGEVLGAFFTWIGTSEDMRRERAKYEKDFPDVVKDSQNPNVEGSFQNGMAFLFTDHIDITDLDRARAKEDGVTPAVAAARRVLTHENMHKGFWLLPAKQQAQIMRFLREMFPAEELDELAKVYTQYADWRTNPAHEVALLDERLQKYIEETKTIPVDGVWKQFWDYIKEIWRKWTGKPKGEPTLSSMKDVVRLLRGALKNAHKARPDVTVGGDMILMSMGATRPNQARKRELYKGDNGNDDIQAKLKEASPDERVDVLNKWLADNPKAAAELEKITAEEAKEAGYNFESFHGTNGDLFTVFDMEMGGVKTAAESASMGIFSTSNPNVAKEYSENIGMGGFFGMALGTDPIVAKALETSEGKSLSDAVSSANEYISSVQSQEFEKIKKPLMDKLVAAGFVDQNGKELADKIVNSAATSEWMSTNQANTNPALKQAYALLDKANAELSNFVLPKIRESLPNKRVLRLRIKAQNPKIYDAGGVTPADFSLSDKIAEAQEAGHDSVIFHNLIDPVESATHYVVFNSEQLKLSDPITFDDDGNIIEDRFVPESNDIRYSYASESAQNSAAGQQAARSTSYTPRQLEVFFGVRKAYEQMPKQNGPSVPLSELFSKTGELVDNLTQAEFDKIVQDMYADNAALLSEGKYLYHGTPHKVDRFRLERIGTGEGAQAFGYGLYFAESKRVGAAYRDNLTKGATFTETLAARSLAQGETEQEIIKKLREYGESKAKAKETLARAKEIQGNLYTVELLPDESEFLDWDKPLSEQSEKVKAALARLQRGQINPDGLDMGGGSVIRDNRRGQAKPGSSSPWVLVSGSAKFDLSQKDVDRMLADAADPTGNQVYTRITAQQGSQQAASEYLTSLGIPGIKYLDAGSRSKDDGSRNFVVFDENSVRIVAENDQPVSTVTTQSGAPASSIVILPTGAMQSLSNPALLTLDDAIQRIEGFTADNEDVDSWPDDVQQRFEESAYNSAIQDNDVLAAWELASPDVRDPKLEPLVEIARKGRQHDVEWDKVANELRAAGKYSIENVDAELAKRLPQDIIDAAQEDTSALDEWVTSDEVLADAKKPFIAEVEQRIAAAIKRVEDTGRYTWNGSEFEPVEDEDVSVRYSYTQTPAQRSAVSQFKADIGEAAKGTAEFADYEGRPIKDYEILPHAKMAAGLYQDAAARLLTSLENDGLTLQDIYLKLKENEDFRLELGLHKIGGNIAELILTAQILQRSKNAINKARTPSQKAQAEKISDTIADYFDGLSTEAGQLLRSVQYIYDDPRTKFSFEQLQAEKKMKKNGTEAVNNKMEGSLPQVKANLSNEIPKVDQQAATDAAEATEAAVEEDQDAIDLAEGEATLEGENKTLFEKVKDWLREIGAAMRHIKSMDSGAMKSISAEQRNAISKMSKEEALAFIQDRQTKINKALKQILGEESDNDTPEQKATRAKRKKMVNTARKRAEQGKEVEAGVKDPTLAKVARAINVARKNIKGPSGKAIQWKQLFSQKGSTVEQVRKNILAEVMDNEAFRDMSDDQKKMVADYFAESWNSEREKIINRMIDENTQTLERQNKKKAAKALNDSRNRILEAVNLGVFDNDELVAILGDKFGIKMKFTEAEKAKLRDLAEKLQDDTLNKVKRNKLGREFLMELEAASQVPMAELLANLWVSAVLSGWNTIISIGLSFLNATGINIVGIHVARAVTAFAKGDVAGAIKAITTMFSDYARHLLSFPSAMNRAWQYLWTGDISFLESGANDPFKKVNSLKEVAHYQVVADLVAKDPNAVKAVLGRFMQFMSRLLQALDGFNVIVTKGGTLHAAMLQSNITPEQILDITLKSDLKIYKDRLVAQDPYFGGKYPTNKRDEAYLNSLAEADMYDELSKLGLKVENQDYLAAESAMTLDPTGVGGHFYNLVRSFDTRIMTSTKERLKQAEADWSVKKDLRNAINYVVWNTLNFIAEQGTNITGVRFARFAGNKFNQSVSFIPLAGLLRLYEADNAKLENAQQAFRDSIWRNQIVGVVVTAIGVQIIRAISDEPDDKKRGWFINGGWNNLTPAQKKQKLSEGQREYTLGFGDKVFNYQNWLPSALLAAIGNVSDMIRYSPDEWKSKGFANQVITAGVSGVQSSLEIPALAQLGQLFANDLATKDPAEKAIGRLGQVLAGWAGGFMPRFLKDIDYMTAPDMRRYTTFYEKVASHIPVYRRYVGNDYYDILGNKIQKNAYPGSRDFGKLKDEPEYQMLGALNARGIWLTPANAEYRMVGKGRYRRRLTQEEADAYSLETGKLYKQMILRYGPRALQMPVERAKDYISDKADAMRDLALQRAMRR